VPAGTTSKLGGMSRAASFRALHSAAAPLRLLNAWDAGSAKVLEAAGAAAIGTTSAGAAWAHGLPDGERVTRDLMLRAVETIAAAVSVPVTADLEAGYDDPAGTVARAIAAGAVGFNLEDGLVGGGLRPLDEQIVLLDAAVAEARAGGGAFVNARTDSVWIGRPDAIAEACARASAYAAAGADGVFVPGAREPDDLAALVAAVAGTDTTINVLAVPGLPSVSELSALGVARVSSGSGPARAAYSAAAAAAREVLDAGTYGAATSGSLTYASLNALMR
jgi:2-methylisocitrate lyase-like PEP mutase family enzyme